MLTTDTTTSTSTGVGVKPDTQAKPVDRNRTSVEGKKEKGMADPNAPGGFANGVVNGPGFNAGSAGPDPRMMSVPTPNVVMPPAPSAMGGGAPGGFNPMVRP